MPDGVDLELVPDEVRQAIAEVVEPVYERFVLGVDDPLEKSLGVTVAHLLWLEVLQQFDLKREYTQFSAVLGVGEDRRGVIDQHLRIIQSKVKVGYLLARLRELRQRWEAGLPDEPSLPGPPDPFGRLVLPASATTSPMKARSAETTHSVDQTGALNVEKTDVVDQTGAPDAEKPGFVNQNEAAARADTARRLPDRGPHRGRTAFC